MLGQLEKLYAQAREEYEKGGKNEVYYVECYREIAWSALPHGLRDVIRKTGVDKSTAITVRFSHLKANFQSDTIAFSDSYSFRVDWKLEHTDDDVDEIVEADIDGLNVHIHLNSQGGFQSAVDLGSSISNMRSNLPLEDLLHPDQLEVAKELQAQIANPVFQEQLLEELLSVFHLDVA